MAVHTEGHDPCSGDPCRAPGDRHHDVGRGRRSRGVVRPGARQGSPEQGRSEEHTSELQSPDHLVCRLLLEKKKVCLLKPCRPARTWSRRTLFPSSGLNPTTTLAPPLLGLRSRNTADAVTTSYL